MCVHHAHKTPTEEHTQTRQEHVNEMHYTLEHTCKNTTYKPSNI